MVVADEAPQHNLRIMVHTGSPQETMDAIKAGGDSVDFGDELIRMMPSLSRPWP
jgi:hypothetical protein